MSKFTDAAATMYGLSVAGMEEASRLGLRDTDVDHLFLALVTSEQAAGQVLRGAGITLAAAREAVAAQHAEQLRALGVDHEPPAPGPIVFHETGGYEWTDRAQEVFKRSGSKGNDGGSIAVLRALLDEPSGLIEAVLSRLGVSGGELLARADAAERIPSFGGVSRPSRGPLSRSTTAFVPAPVGDVWELLADPRRMPEWDLMLGVVDVPGGAGEGAPRVGDVWGASLATHAPDGKPFKQRPGMQRASIELLASDERELISWRVQYPGNPRANSRRTTIALAPAAGGTQLGISFEWEPVARRRAPSLAKRAQRLLMRPAMRFAVWMQTAQIGSGISRVFRSTPGG